MRGDGSVPTVAGPWVLRLALVGLVALAGLVVVSAAEAQGGGATAPVEVRVWQNVGDLEDIRISARPAGGDWRILGTIPLPLDETTDSGTFVYGDIDLDVALAGRATPATVEVRVWQRIGANERVYISARPAGGDWDVLGTIRLLLDDGVTPSGTFWFGDIRLDVPLPGEVTTLAGAVGVQAYVDGRGDEAGFAQIGAVEVDSDGSVIVGDDGAIRRIGLEGTVTTIAGRPGCGVRNGQGAAAGFCGPRDVAVAQDGTIYVAEGENGFRRVTRDGVVTRPYGSPFAEGVVRASEDLPSPLWVGGVAFDGAGNLYVLEEGGAYSEGRSILRYPPSGEAPTVHELVWNEAYGGRGFDVDDAGNIYLLDWFGDRTVLSMVDTSGVVSTLYEDESPHFGGVLAHAEGLAVAGDGTIYVANTGRNQIVRLTRDGSLVGVAGDGETGHRDGAPGEARFSLPRALAVAPDGALVVADQDARVVRVIAPGLKGVEEVSVELVRPVELARVAVEGVSVLAGVRGFHASTLPRFRDGPAEQALFAWPSGLALDAAGGVIVADAGNHAIRRISPEGVVTTVAGGNGPGLLDGPVDEAQIPGPQDVAVDVDGTIYVRANFIRSVSSEGRVTTLEAALGYDFNFQVEMALDHDGRSLLLSYKGILQLSPEGEISAVAGRDVGANGPIAVDSYGHVYAFRYGWPTHVILKIARDGAVTTVFEDRPGDYGGLLSWAVSDLFVAPDGTLYVADPLYQRVVRISAHGEASVVVDQSTFAALGAFRPESIVLTPEAGLLVADWGMNVIWKITLPDEDEDEADE